MRRAITRKPSRMFFINNEADDFAEPLADDFDFAEPLPLDNDADDFADRVLELLAFDIGNGARRRMPRFDT